MLKQSWPWVLCAVVGVLAICAMVWAAPVAPSFPDHRTSDDALLTYQPGGDCRNLPARSPREPLELSKVRARCVDLSDTYRLQTQDVILQSRAIDAARVQALLMYQSNRIAFLALIGGLITLVAAIAAAIYAKHAAKAARDSLFHSQSVAALELRPYVDFTGVKIRSMNDRPELVVHIENFGRVPATVVKVEVGDALVPKTGRFGLPALRDTRFDARSIAPGSSIDSIHRSLLKARNLTSVEAGTGRIVFYFKIHYSDFNRTFEDTLERAWMIRPEHLTSGRTLTRVHKTRHLTRS